VREELLTRAADVFERQGFAQTRIQDIAEALGLSRSALYHYFTSKEDILAALIAEHTERRAAAMVALVSDSSRSAAERLRAALRATIAERLTGGPRLRVLDQLAIEMPPNLRTTFDRARRQVLNLYTDLIKEGVDNCEFRPVDARVAAFAVLGIAAWTSWWYSPGGRKTPDELADLLTDIGLNGLLSRAGDQPLATDRASLLRQIRERLDLLERL
jgi:AcrR family transcriptional regulator